MYIEINVNKSIYLEPYPEACVQKYLKVSSIYAKYLKV